MVWVTNTSYDWLIGWKPSTYRNTLVYISIFVLGTFWGFKTLRDQNAKNDVDLSSTDALRSLPAFTSLSVY